MRNKMCSIFQDSVDWCEGKTVIPGIRRKIFYVANGKILTRPDLEMESVNPTRDVLSGGEYTLAEGEFFHCIDVDAAKSSFTSEPQGEMPSQTQLNKLTLVHPGVDAISSLAASYINNIPCEVLFQDGNGEWRVLRNRYFPVKGTVAENLGEGPTGTAATTITFEATDIIPAPYVTGIKIKTEMGEVTLDQNFI